jgi:hypothetical protein
MQPAASEFHRCARDKGKMVTWLQENWIALLALIISIFALYFTYKQSSLALKQAHLHIEPLIKTYFDLPKEKNPVFVIANEGDIPVVSVCVGNRVFCFDKNSEKIVFASKASRIFSSGALFRESLKPTEYENLELLKVSPQEHIIVVYEFSLKYFREKDMKEFVRTEYFFIDGFNMVPHSDFLKHRFYRTLMAEITNFKMPSQKMIQGTLQQYLDSISNQNNENGRPDTSANVKKSLH